jgi:CO/xanthine dehydrogenase FAD-binding subunit
MNRFSYARAVDVAGAISEVSRDAAAKFIAGGTNLIDLMKENVARPNRLIDITRLPLNRIHDTPDGLPPASRKTLSAAVAGNTLRRFTPASQHGDQRRKSVATNPLLLLLRYGHTLQ